MDNSATHPPAQASDEQANFDRQLANAMPKQIAAWRAEVARLNDLIAHASGVQASDEPMRAAFWKFIATLPTPVQDNISTSEARGESITAKAFESGYRAALATPRATADVERVEAILRRIETDLMTVRRSSINTLQLRRAMLASEERVRKYFATKGAKP